MPYVGGSLTSLFDGKQQARTKLAMRHMAERATDRWQAVTTQNTPIGGRALEGDGGGNLRSSWYTTPAQRVAHPAGPAYQATVASDVEYAPHVEHGTGLWGPKAAKYKIEPKTPGGMLRWRNNMGGFTYAKSVMHPGSPGQHMLQIGATVVQTEANDYGVGAEWAEAIERGAD